MTSPADEKARVAGVFDRAAPTYERTGVAFFDPIGAALVAAAGLRPGDRVLDVGCGAGASLLPAATAVGPHGTVTGIDLAQACGTPRRLRSPDAACPTRPS